MFKMKEIRKAIVAVADQLRNGGFTGTYYSIGIDEHEQSSKQFRISIVRID